MAPFFFMLVMGGIVGACHSGSSPTLPLWWECTADTTISRQSLLGQPIAIAKKAESGLYYDDSMGCTFQYTLPSEGKLWVEYYASKDTIRTIALVWESDSFTRLTDMYQKLRTTYTRQYGEPSGAVGDLEWRIADTLRVVLRLSPERRYLHSSFSLLSPDENLHQNR